MISIDKGYIKNSPEYENLGDNIFPIDFLSDDEKKELGLIKKSCCGSSNGCCKSKGHNSSSCCKGDMNKCGK